MPPLHRIALLLWIALAACADTAPAPEPQTTDAPPPASGRVMFVDDDAQHQPGYDNTATVGSEQRPFFNIQSAFDGAAPGDTIVVRAGLYDAGGRGNNRRILRIEEHQGGSPAAPITITAYPGERPILDGAVAGTGPHHLVEILGHDVVFGGFELRNVKENAILIRSPAHHVTVRDCIVHDFSRQARTRAGIMGSGPVQYLVIEDNLVHGPGGVGIFLDDNGGLGGKDKVPPTGRLSRYPRIEPSAWAQWPGYADIAPRHCIVRRNLVHGMDSSAEGSDGIAVNYAIDCTIADNIVYSNYDDNIDGLGATRCTFARNICFWANPGVEGGDGNGIKIGVRGALDNLVHHNILFENRRAGLDLTLSYRSRVYNNTCVNNGWRGMSYGDTAPQMQENPSAVVLVNNLCISAHGAARDASFAIAKSAATDVSLMDNSHNAVNDDNHHGSEDVWSLPLGPGSHMELDPEAVLPNWRSGTLDLEPSGELTIPQRMALIRQQVTERFAPTPDSPLATGGRVIPDLAETAGPVVPIGALSARSR